jgi:hypothetical protein
MEDEIEEEYSTNCKGAHTDFRVNALFIRFLSASNNTLVKLYNLRIYSLCNIFHSQRSSLKLHIKKVWSYVILS